MTILDEILAAMWADLPTTPEAERPALLRNPAGPEKWEEE